MKRNVGILIFDDAEVLDFAGPFEVFSVTSQLNDDKLFNVFTVAKITRPISAVNGLSVNPAYNFDNAPPIHILLISGGSGTRHQMKDLDTLNWVKQIHKHSEFTASICSGARLLGALRLLDEKPYCTHQEVYEDMKEISPTGFPQMSRRFVNTGKIYTSGGISAGIDLSFHMIEKLHGKNIADKTANYLEYNYLNNTNT